MTIAHTQTSCELGGHRWDFKFTATSLRALQMTMGSLEEFSARLLAENMGTGLSLESQAVLIWAGQRTVEPKLKFGWVKRFLQTIAPEVRALLVTWAAADYCRTLLEMADARIAATLPDSAQVSEDADELPQISR